MPGKVNPTQSEAMTMVCVQVFGNDAAVGFAGSQGNFELNVFKPVIVHNFSSDRPDRGRLPRLRRALRRRASSPTARASTRPRRSLMLVTALNRHIGYDKAAAIAKNAHKKGITLRESALASGLVSAEDYDRWIVPVEMTHPSA